MTHASTSAARAGIASDRHHGAVVPPLHLSANFAFEGFNKPRAFDYTRSGNPTRSLLAGAIARCRPRLVWAETPSNPLLRITDIAAVATVAHLVGALVVVDNTFLSPV